MDDGLACIHNGFPTLRSRFRFRAFDQRVRNLRQHSQGLGTYVFDVLRELRDCQDVLIDDKDIQLTPPSLFCFTTEGVLNRIVSIAKRRNA